MGQKNYKEGQLFPITKWGKIITKWGSSKLQSGAKKSQSGAGITKWGKITKWGITLYNETAKFSEKLPDFN